MKFISNLLTLLAVTSTSVFAFDIGLSTFDFSDKSNESCMNSIDEFSTNCLIKDEININNIDEACQKFNNEFCQTKFQSGAEGFDQCNNSLFGFDELMNTYYVAMKYFCERDENGEICPLAAAALTDDNGSLKSEDEQLIQSVKDTCNSEKCKEVTREFLMNSSEKTSEFIGFFVNIINAIGIDDPELKNATYAFDDFYGNIIKSIDRGDCIVTKEEITPNDANVKSSKVNFAFIVFIGLLLVLV